MEPVGIGVGVQTGHGLLALIRRESSVSLWNLAAVSALSALSNALVLAIVNAAVGETASGMHHLRFLVLFGIALAVFIITRKYILVTSISEVEGILDRLRVRLANKIRHADLEYLERTGEGRIYSALQTDLVTISQAERPIIGGLHAAVLLIFTMIYVAWVSRAGFLLCLVLVLLSFVLYSRERTVVQLEMREALVRESEVLDAFRHLVGGFKEVKMNAARSADLYTHLTHRSALASRLKTKVEIRFALLSVYVQGAFYVGVAAMVFLLPRLTIVESGVIVKLTTAVLFAIGPITAVVAMLPSLADADASADSLGQLEGTLDRSVRTVAALPGAGFGAFREITFESVVYRYDDAPSESSFTVGPVDLAVRAREILFITGGNGSGKSTLLKLLAALYYPSSGVIRVDGTPLGESNFEAYRSLFSVVFSDYHLFDRLYGLAGVDPARLEQLLRETDLERKTAIKDGVFTTLDLSVGQRKRLALIVALLEDRPVCVFDEWAADQDPAFRRKFYEQLLPELRAQGKTIVASTHDDRFFAVADRVLELQEGRVVQRSGRSEHGG